MLHYRYASFTVLIGLHPGWIDLWEHFADISSEGS